VSSTPWPFFSTNDAGQASTVPRTGVDSQVDRAGSVTPVRTISIGQAPGTSAAALSSSVWPSSSAQRRNRALRSLRSSALAASMSQR
jgi:hypothetical protein